MATRAGVNRSNRLAETSHINIRYLFVIIHFSTTCLALCKTMPRSLPFFASPHTLETPLWRPILDKNAKINMRQMAETDAMAKPVTENRESEPAKFTDLPTEIIVKICNDYIKFDNQGENMIRGKDALQFFQSRLTLIRLMKTCRDFYVIVKPHVYRVVSMDQFKSRRQLFNHCRAGVDCALVGKSNECVKDVGITIGRSDTIRHFWKDAFHIWIDYLQSLSNVEILTLMVDTVPRAEYQDEQMKAVLKVIATWPKLKQLFIAYQYHPGDMVSVAKGKWFPDMTRATICLHESVMPRLRRVKINSFGCGWGMKDLESACLNPKFDPIEIHIRFLHLIEHDSGHGNGNTRHMIKEFGKWVANKKRLEQITTIGAHTNIVVHVAPKVDQVDLDRPIVCLTEEDMTAIKAKLAERGYLRINIFMPFVNANGQVLKKSSEEQFWKSLGSQVKVFDEKDLPPPRRRSDSVSFAFEVGA